MFTSLSILATAGVSLGAKLLAVVLWTGLAGLTIALVVLMRTRWGHARPLSKCVALSLYAHVLLMTYAYGTHLVIPTPPGDDSDFATVQLIGADDDQQQAPAPGPSDAKATPAPWEQLSVDTPEPLSLEEPARVETRIDTPPPTPLERSSEPPEQPLPMPTATPLEESKPQEQPPTRAAPLTPAAPTPIEVTSTQRQDVIEPILPQTQGPERMSVGEVAAKPSETAKLPAPDAGAKLQELTELLTTSTVAEALASRADRLDPARSMSPADNSAGGDAVVLQGAAAAIVHRQMSRRVPKRLADGEPVPELYRMRVAQDRKRIARRLGATKESDEAVEAALRWLSANQSADGRWSAKRFGAGEERKVLGHDRQGAGADADTGITALAVLSMLGAGHTHLEGPYRENVQRALEYLCSQQKTDGSLAGEAKLYAMMYCHGMAALALGEAYAMTGDHRLKPYVEKGAEFTIRAQHGSTGGWRYLPGDPGDMSQFGWQVMALKSAELAGLTVPEKNRHGMQRFLQNNTSGRFHGLASYRAGERPSRTMTAEAYACRTFLGEPVSPELTTEAADFILEDPPQSGKADFYYWYYGSLAMFQLQDHRWAKWNQALQRELHSRQIKSGEEQGSFPTDEVWSGYGGRVYTTSMAALCLEVYYRYLPVYGSE